VSLRESKGQKMENKKFVFEDDFALDLFWKLTENEEVFWLYQKNVDLLEKIEGQILNEDNELVKTLKITIEVN